MTGMPLLLAALALIVAGAAVALGLRRSPDLAAWCASSALAVGAVAGLVPVMQVLLGGPTLSFSGPWPMPNGAFLVELDPLSAFFLVPVFVVAGLGGLFGREYLKEDSRSGVAAAGYNLLAFSMAMVVLARNGILFLVAWEAMAVAAFFLVAFDHHKAEARRAGWLYIVAAHLGAAALFAMFLLLAKEAKSYDFAAFAAHPPTGARATVVAGLAVVGFGAKAGFFPLHVWLPEAHAAAVSHASALMSGALIKLGLYGILRVFLILGTPAGGWGTALAVIGLLSALIAIALAVYQRDLKRALAYSSVENVGLMALGIGVAWEAMAAGAPTVAALAMAGALFHVWNHMLMKATMFLGAGSILHATHSRDLEKLGGLLRKMPVTGGTFIVGAVALSALPPLNGFVSEWLIYRGLLERALGPATPGGLLAAIAVGAVALIGGLAALSFARLCGIALLGHPRSEAAAQAHEGGVATTGVLSLLAAGCVAMALVPTAVVFAVARVTGQVLKVEPGAVVASLGLESVGQFNAGLWVLIGVSLAAVAWLARRRPEAQAETWGCGYVAPERRMQYGALSFAELAAEHVLPNWLRPSVQRGTREELFAEPSRLEASTPDPVTHRVYEPLLWWWAGRLSSFWWIQRGAVQWYLLYVLGAVLLGLGWFFVRGWLA
jgi:formate hydrogenlyase subunit 3/multisubunit Na+/H+ antiporter MnhD subunit